MSSKCDLQGQVWTHAYSCTFITMQGNLESGSSYDVTKVPGGHVPCRGLTQVFYLGVHASVLGDGFIHKHRLPSHAC